MLIVQKYGGSSVADDKKIKNVASRVVEASKNGHKLVIVLSAQGDTTDDLIEKAKQLSDNPSKREMDMLLATGEQQSIALMAIAIHALGFKAVSLNAGQAGIQSSSDHSNARIKQIDTERIEAELNNNNIVLVAGFQGFNRFGDVTTLGRGGSDTTAVALAAALKADLCEIYTDVSGVYTCDPRAVKNAKKLDSIDYDEMLELASLGAGVLHNRSVELAKKYNIKLVVRSSFSKEEGTLIREQKNIETTFITGIAIDKDISRIAIVSIPDVPGKAYQIFNELGKAKISVDIMLQSIGREGLKDISFTVSRENMEKTVELLKKIQSDVGFKEVVDDENVAKLSIVGAGMASNPGIASLMFEALFEVGININMISTSEMKLSVLLKEEEVNAAANAVHKKFLEKDLEVGSIE